MTKGYAVLPVNLEYNDEVYQPKGYGKVTKVYKTKVKALAACNEANVKFLKEFRSFEYSYSPGFKGLLDETMSYYDNGPKQELLEMFKPVLEQLNDDEEKHGDIILGHLKTLPTVQQERFYEIFPLLQYQVVEVDIT